MGELKNLENEKVLNKSELKKVSGGAVVYPESKAACPQCGKHSLIFSDGIGATICTSCGFEQQALCPECGTIGLRFNKEAGAIVCTGCGAKFSAMG